MKWCYGFAAALITVSLACSAYKSAGSTNVQTNTPGVSQQQPASSPTPVKEKVPCTLTLAGAPDLNGLRLGMTPKEVLAVFPGSSEDPQLKSSIARPPSKFGDSGFVIKPNNYGANEKFADATLVSIITFDGRVSTVTVNYNGPEFSHVDKFVEKIAQKYQLPTVESWDPYPGLDDTLKVLKCSDFEVRAFIGGKGGTLNYIELRDLIAAKNRNERRAKAKAQATPGP